MMETTAYKGKIFEIVEKELEENGKTKVFEFARRAPGVRLIVPKGNELMITKEFRHEIGGYDYRLAG